MKAVVLLAHGNGCEASRQAETSLDASRTKFESQGVAFLAIDSNLADGREAIATQSTRSNIGMPILVDDSQLIGESLGLTHTGEVLIVEPRQGWKVVWHGAATGGGSDQLGAALAAVLAGSAVPAATTKPSGCPIAMPERARRAAHSQISYEKSIAPLLIDKCVTCHREG